MNHSQHVAAARNHIQRPSLAADSEAALSLYEGKLRRIVNLRCAYMYFRFSFSQRFMGISCQDTSIEMAADQGCMATNVIEPETASKLPQGYSVRIDTSVP